MPGLKMIYFIFLYMLKEIWVLCAIIYFLSPQEFFLEMLKTLIQCLKTMYSSWTSEVFYPVRGVAWNFSKLKLHWVLSCGSSLTFNMQPQSHINSSFIPRTQLNGVFVYELICNKPTETQQ